MLIEAAASALFQQFTISVPVTVRESVAEDLPALEWYGMFHQHSAIIRSAFERQQRGENLMLVAEANRFPIGQLWIDFTKKRAESCGVLWAFRIIEPFQRRGLGTRLLATAEQILRQRRFALAELGVEKGNVEARRFYLRHGYRKAGEELIEFSVPTPEDRLLAIRVDQWLFRKQLNKTARSAQATPTAKREEREKWKGIMGT